METRKEAIGLAFGSVDKRLMEWQNHARFGKDTEEGESGTTALCALVYRKENKILVANLGDSRCVLGGG